VMVCCRRSLVTSLAFLVVYISWGSSDSSGVVSGFGVSKMIWVQKIAAEVDLFLPRAFDPLFMSLCGTHVEIGREYVPSLIKRRLPFRFHVAARRLPLIVRR